MVFRQILFGTATILLCAGMLVASPKDSPLQVSPQEVSLSSKRAYRQLIVTGNAGGAAHDLTQDAVYRTLDPRVAVVKEGRILPVGNGKTTIEVTAEGKTARIPVTVSQFGKPDPVQFQFETLATLTKQGCAGGSCHGSPHGKGGFSLSLFGYDPMIDRISLTHEGYNRRVNVLEPTESLMLKKPLLEIPHVGGKRLRKTDASYNVLKQWIYEGANVNLTKVECSKIVLTPDTGRILHAPFLKQQLSVLAYYTDGTVRDVTAIATYDTSHPFVATVDAEGRITGRRRGQAAISVRYLDKLQSLPITVVEDVPGFVWKPSPENNMVDRLVNAKLKQLQYLPSETCRDEEFLRRVSLDLTGVLPTPDVTRAFLKDRSPDKRARWIDRLLDTEEYARFQATKLADLMHLTPQRLRDGRADRFARWLVDGIRQNRPYDAFARDILTAAGDTEDIAPANYFLAIPSTEERTEMTSQIFMGTRVECAKCHNHPFENWTMRDYYRIAAVFARVTEEKGEVKLAKDGESLLPTTKEVMAPWGLVKNAGAQATDRRVVFATWLTDPKNPYFARVAVNRMWASLMGRGIVEPVDDFRSSNPPANGPLLDWLAEEFIRSGYDRKHLLRLICNSQTYQRSTKTNRFNVTDDALFSHAKIRLLTAEQLKDAITLTTRSLPAPGQRETELADLDRQIQERKAKRLPDFAAWLAAKETEAAAKPRSKEQMEKDEGRLNDLRNIPPADRSEKQTAEIYTLVLTDILAISADKRTEKQQKALTTIFLAQDSDYTNLLRRWETLANRMEYATQRPYPDGTRFTATFGQPSRQTACTCERQNAPTLLQALELLNGNTAAEMARQAVERYRGLDDTHLIEELYLAGLCRYPTAKESTAALAYLKGPGETDRKRMDLIWTLVSTQEFLFQH